jgi:hypothetical protein
MMLRTPGTSEAAMRDHKTLESALRTIVTDLGNKLTSVERVDVIDFVDNGEYGIALETLCAILTENDRFVAKEVLGRIQKVGTEMELDPKTWSQVKAEG